MRVIEWLRFLGLLNASLWLGTCVYHVLGALPSLSAAANARILGTANAAYYGTAFRQLLDESFWYFNFIFALVACAHAVTMWLYLGRTPRRAWLGLLAGLILIASLEAMVLQPALRSLHLTRHSPRMPPQTRATANSSFKAWQGFSVVLMFLQFSGLAVYFWRMANPSEAPRFVSAVKFRS